MKTIGSFKLHKGGEQGISITTEQLSKPISGDDSMVFHDEVNTFRKEKTPRHILDAIERLKYYFMNITGYWIDVYTPYLELETNLLKPLGDNPKPGRIHLQNLWESIKVTQVHIDSSSWTLMGQIEVIDNKPLNLNPSKITPQDEVEFYEATRQTIKGIITLLVGYFSTAAIKDVNDMRRFLLAHSDETKKHEITNLDEQQIFNKVMDLFVHKGMVVMADQGVLDQYEIPTEEEVITEDIIESPDIDLESEPIDDDMTTGDDWTPPKEKVKEPFGPPVAENGKAEVVNPAMAHTQSIGEEDVIDPEPVIDDLSTFSDDDFV